MELLKVAVERDRSIYVCRRCWATNHRAGNVWRISKRLRERQRVRTHSRMKKYKIKGSWRPEKARKTTRRSLELESLEQKDRINRIWKNLKVPLSQRCLHLESKDCLWSSAVKISLMNLTSFFLYYKYQIIFIPYYCKYATHKILK